jgi:SAM-dependent methyltransferase
VSLPRTYLRVPPRPHVSRARLLAHGVAATALVPAYWALAAYKGVPGLKARTRALELGARLALAPRAPFALSAAARLMLMPLDSTRFFELEFVERAVSGRPARRLLDVSSPRLVPVMLLEARPELEAELINPDPKDLADTRAMIAAAGLESRCRTHATVIAEAPLEPESFDLITCISVLEHIAEDTAALRTMWRLLKPGGALVLTVPAMARASEQYIDENEYGVLRPGDDGWVFWQRYYDQRLLEERVLSVTGPPALREIYGEKVAGSFARNAEEKRRLRAAYPFWKEPWMMAVEYRSFDALDALPGEGVIGMRFDKR